MATDRRGDAVEVDGKAFRFNDEFFDLRAEKVGALRCGGVGKQRDDGPYAWPGFEQAVV